MNSHSAIVEFIFARFDEGQDEDEIISFLTTQHGIEEDDAAWAVEMTKTGAFRAAVIGKGINYPHSNIDDDPYLNAAINCAKDRSRKRQQEIVNVAHASPDPQQRADAILELGKLNDPALTTILPIALQDQDTSVRLAAVKAINRDTMTTLSERIIDIYVNEEDIHVSAALSALFKQHKWRAAIPALIEKLDADNKIIKLYAIEALGELKAKEAKEKIKAYNKDTTPLNVYDHKGNIVFYAGTNLAIASRKALKNISSFRFW